MGVRQRQMAWKEIVAQGILDEIFKPEQNRLQKIMEKIMEENHYHHGGSLLCLNFEGETFTFDRRGVWEKKRTPVHESLYDRTKEVVGKWKQVSQDRTLVFNILSTILSRCKTGQDVRDALPELLAPHTYPNLSRTRPAGYVFADDPKMMKQFQQMLDVIYHYWVNKLVF